MTGYSWTAWLWWIGGALLGLLGLWLLYWSLLRDRSKGRRRCPKCWYNMSGTDSMTCSECGRTAKREKRLYTTRRRWRGAGAAVMLLIGGHFVHTTPRIQRGGLYGAVPTSVLIAGFPWRYKMRWSTTLAYSADIDEDVSYELERRARSSEMWSWQRRWLARIAIQRLSDSTPWDSTSVSQATDLFEAIGVDARAAYAQLLDYLQSDNSSLVREAGYLLSIQPTDDPAILEAVAGLLEHEDEWVRERVPFYLVSCAKRDPEFLVPELLKALHDSSPGVVVSAMASTLDLGPTGDSLIPAIEELRQHENEKVRYFADWVLQRIAPKQSQPSPKSKSSSP